MRKKDKLQAANLEGTADDVEDAFYRALQKATSTSSWLAGRRRRHRLYPPRRAAGGRRHAIRATFEAMFSNGSIRAWPERARKTQAVASAVHNVLERSGNAGPERPRACLGHRHQRLSQDRARLAHGGPPCEPGNPPRNPGSLGHAAVLH
jgi:hypothetical protein